MNDWRVVIENLPHCVFRREGMPGALVGQGIGVCRFGWGCRSRQRDRPDPADGNSLARRQEAVSGRDGGPRVLLTERSGPGLLTRSCRSPGLPGMDLPRAGPSGSRVWGREGLLVRDRIGDWSVPMSKSGHS